MARYSAKPGQPVTALLLKSDTIIWCTSIDEVVSNDGVFLDFTKDLFTVLAGFVGISNSSNGTGASC